MTRLMFLWRHTFICLRIYIDTGKKERKKNYFQTAHLFYLSFKYIFLKTHYIPNMGIIKCTNKDLPFLALPVAGHQNASPTSSFSLSSESSSVTPTACISTLITSANLLFELPHKREIGKVIFITSQNAQHPSSVHVLTNSLSPLSLNCFP